MPAASSQSWRADRRVESTQDFFRRGNKNDSETSVMETDNDLFATPGKSAMRGALARSLTAATSSPHQGEVAETLNLAKEVREVGGKLDVGAGDRAEEVANEVDMEGMAACEKPATPTPAERTRATPVPVTLTKGNKRMAVGTPKVTRHRTMRLMPVGFAAASALEQIL